MSFKELEEPLAISLGWYMAIKNDGPGWLTINGLLSSSTDDTSIFYFETEFEILQMAFQYYFTNGELFPFTDRLVELQRQAGAVHTPTIKKSRVMEFE